MNVESSILEIFQDPLLTIIAIILLQTLWIIIPGPLAETMVNDNFSQTPKRMEELKEEIKLLDERIDKLGKKIERLWDEIHAVEQSNNKAKKKMVKEKIAKLVEEIAKLKAMIQSKKNDLNELEKRLEEARKRVNQAKVVKELDEGIRGLKEEIAQKEGLIKKLENELKKAKDAQEKTKSSLDKKREEIMSLELQVAMKIEDLVKLETDKRTIEKSLTAKGNGIEIYSQELVNGKEQIAFEAIRNRIVLIGKNNYDVETFFNIDNSQIVAAKLIKKESVDGESTNLITNPNSRFQSKLTELDPQKHYLLFVVRKDSFEVFLKARQIASQKTLVTAWQPLEDDGSIYVGSGGEKVEGRK